MTRWFDEFHKLSDEQLIEIPSDSEGEESPAGIDLENEPVREDTSQGNQPGTNEPTHPETDELQNLLCNLVPVHLIPSGLLKDICQNSQRLLNEAIDETADINDICIDTSCLPSWPGRTWDPDCETLHSVLQTRLDEHEASLQLGSMIRDIVVKLGNQRLDDARRLGISLQDIYIGYDLLPDWSQEGRKLRRPEEIVDLEEDIGDTFINSDVDMPDAGSSTDKAELASSPVPDTADLHSFSYQTNTSDSEDKNDYDDVVSLCNFVQDTPSLHHYSRHEEDDPPNVVHDVDLVSADGTFSIDFELFLAQDDDELQGLPEIEMAINRDGYEEHYEYENAVDLEVEGAEIICTVPEVTEPDDQIRENEEVENSSEDGRAQPEDPLGWIQI